MIFTTIEKKDILKKVLDSVEHSQKEILATMLLKEEIENPLSDSYFELLKKKTDKEVILKRLGFGGKEDYNRVKNKIPLENKNYIFRYNQDESLYQRLIIIDKTRLFFGKDGLFFESTYKPLINVFKDYFIKHFKNAYE